MFIIIETIVVAFILFCNAASCLAHNRLVSFVFSEFFTALLLEVSLLVVVIWIPNNIIRIGLVLLSPLNLFRLPRAAVLLFEMIRDNAHERSIQPVMTGRYLWLCGSNKQSAILIDKSSNTKMILLDDHTATATHDPIRVIFYPLSHIAESSPDLCVNSFR